MDRIKELRALLEDESSDVAVAALEAIEIEATPEWLPTLNRWLLEPEEAYLRFAAASAVARLEGISGLLKLLDAMALGESEGNPKPGLEMIVEGLVSSAPLDQSLPMLEFLASSETLEDRLNAVWLLLQIDSDMPADCLKRLTRDSAHEVRLMACGQLSAYPFDAEARTCLDRCLGDPHDAVRVEAQSALKVFERWERRHGRP